MFSWVRSVLYRSCTASRLVRQARGLDYLLEIAIYLIYVIYLSDVWKCT